MLLAPLFPGTPDRGLLLRHADQHHAALTALPRGCLQVGTGDGLLALTLLEVHNRDLPFLGEPMNRGHVAVADSAERSG
jgi:hypothetical protein